MVSLVIVNSACCKTAASPLTFKSACLGTGHQIIYVRKRIKSLARGHLTALCRCSRTKGVLAARSVGCQGLCSSLVISDLAPMRVP